MKQIKFMNSFKKTAKKHKNEYDKKELDDCLEIIASGNDLDPKYKNHRLRRPWKKGDKNPYSEFHITNRLCVVYLVLQDVIEVYALGTHKELKLGESFIK